ncbi:MAG TPA: hypothetical protein VKR61_20080 [Bryobacteraceae bacterium]|nr:hypothetical protein [Bryobacteraceae bacterium]
MTRISGAAPERITPEARRVFERQEQFYGAVLHNHAVLARRPAIFRGFRAMWDGLEEDALLPARLRDLVNLKVATLIGCGL